MTGLQFAYHKLDLCADGDLNKHRIAQLLTCQPHAIISSWKLSEPMLHSFSNRTRQHSAQACAPQHCPLKRLKYHKPFSQQRGSTQNTLSSRQMKTHMTGLQP